MPESPLKSQYGTSSPGLASKGVVSRYSKVKKSAEKHSWQAVKDCQTTTLYSSIQRSLGQQERFKFNIEKLNTQRQHRKSNDYSDINKNTSDQSGSLLQSSVTRKMRDSELQRVFDHTKTMELKSRMKPNALRSF